MKAHMRVEVSKCLSAHVFQSVSFLYIVVFCQLDFLSWADFNTILIVTACLICFIVLKSIATKFYILILVNSQHISQNSVYKALSTESFLYNLNNVTYHIMKSKILLLFFLHSMLESHYINSYRLFNSKKIWLLSAFLTSFRIFIYIFLSSSELR